MLDFKKDYILENDYVLLRPLVPEDYEMLLEYSENEPDIWRFNAFGANNRDNLKKYIDTALKNKNAETEYPFVVVDKATGKVIGSTRYYSISTMYNTLEIGYTWYGKKYQGTAVNKNCKYLLLEFAFENLGVERVGFKANKDNYRSINAMKSIGCKEEGIMRNLGTDGEGNRIDVAVLSIIREEWYNETKENLKKKL